MNNRFIGWRLSALATYFCCALSGCGGSADPGAEVAERTPLVVYSSRNEQLIKPIFDAYTAATGQPIRFITDGAGPLIERLRAEGDATPADILLTVDAGNLWHAAELGLLRPLADSKLATAIPAALRDPGNRWFGLSVRARTLVYHSARVDPAELSDYVDLASPQWRDRLCLRTSKKVYNQSLVAMLIAQLGEAKAEEVVRGWVANLATDVFSSDTKLLEGMLAGQCDVGVINTYYLGRMLKQQPDLPLKIFWADQDSAGVHVNVAGAGVTVGSKQPAAAAALLEWLGEGEAQRQFAAVNLEFPVDPNIEVDPLIAAWGTFKSSPINVARAGELQSAAVKLMDRAGYR